MRINFIDFVIPNTNRKSPLKAGTVFSRTIVLLVCVCCLSGCFGTLAFFIPKVQTIRPKPPEAEQLLVYKIWEADYLLVMDKAVAVETLQRLQKDTSAQHMYDQKDLTSVIEKLSTGTDTLVYGFEAGMTEERRVFKTVFSRQLRQTGNVGIYSAEQEGWVNRIGMVKGNTGSHCSGYRFFIPHWRKDSTGKRHIDEEILFLHTTDCTGGLKFR